MIVRNNAFDIIRLIAAFFVVLAHTGYPFALGRFAVPFFFMISGFYWEQMDEQKHISQIGKLFSITLYATLIYAIWLVFDTIVLKGFPLDCNMFVKFLLLNLLILIIIKIVGLLSWAGVIGLSILNIITPNTHLWYLYAVLWVLVLLFKLDKSTKNYYKFIKYFPLLLLPCCLLSFGGKVMVYRNFLFEGLPYISIGILIRKYYQISYRKKSMLLALFFGIILLFVEVYFYKSLGWVINRDHYLLTFPTTFLIFSIALKLKCNNNFVATLGRKYSSGIYIWHMIFVYLFEKINFLETKCFLGIIVFIVSLIFSIIINNLYFIKNRKLQ